MNIQQVTPTKTFKPKLVLGLLLLFATTYLFSQNKLLKLEREFSFNSLPKFVLNASHSNILISSWEKKSVGIKAYSSGNVSNQALEKANSLWEIKLQQSDSIVLLDTDASKQLPQKIITNYGAEGVKIPVDSNNVLLTSVLNPLLSNLEYSTMPKVLKDRINQSRFNFEAYRNLGDTYFKIWEFNLVKDLDKTSIKEVKNWYDQMSNNLLKVSNSITNVSANRKEVYRFYESTTTPIDLIKKTIEIKLPKKMASELITSFGSVTILDTSYNLKAKLKYTDFVAQNIMGKQTNISVSSAPVKINYWQNGTLKLKYVKEAAINVATNIRLFVISSKALFQNIEGSGVFKSTFSHIGINAISDNFKNLSFLNTNSDLVLNLPDQAYNFVYSGEMSGIKIPPNKLTLKSLGDYRKLVLHGYSKTRNTDKEIQMNMVNSQILLK